MLFVVFVFCFGERIITTKRERKNRSEFFKEAEEEAMIKLDFATEKGRREKEEGNARRVKFLISFPSLLYAKKKKTKKNDVYDVNDDDHNKSLRRRPWWCVE